MKKILAYVLVLIFVAGGSIVLTNCKNKVNIVKTESAPEKTVVESEKSVIEPEMKELLPVEIGIDHTASSDLTVLKPSVEILRKAIEVQQIPKIAVARLGEGGKSSWAESLKLFQMTLIPTGIFDVTAAENSIEQKCRTRLRCRQERLKKMREDFDSMKAEKMKSALTERGGKSHEIADLILEPPKGEAQCSDLIGFRDRLFSDAYKRVVFYSDGLHDCATPISTKRFAPDVKVLILQLPVKGENSGVAFAERTKMLQQIFTGDGVTIMPVVSANEETFKKFFE